MSLGNAVDQRRQNNRFHTTFSVYALSAAENLSFVLPGNPVRCVVEYTGEVQGFFPGKSQGVCERSEKVTHKQLII